MVLFYAGIAHCHEDGVQKTRCESITTQRIGTMKTLLTVIIALFAEVLAEGAIGSLPIGSSNVVENYNITNATYASSTVRWTQTNGNTRIQWKTHDSLSFASKQQMLDYNQQTLISDINLSVGSDPLADKTKPVYVSIIYGKTGSPRWSMSTRSQNFTYVYVGGNYQIPDLSWIIPGTADQVIPINIKNLKWGRVEVRLASNPTQLYYITDSRSNTNGPTTLNPTAVELDSYFYQGCLNIGTPIAYSGENGSYKVRVYLVSGTNNTYEIFDGDGAKVSETLLSITNFSVSYGQINMDILGGDVGRVFILEKSIDLLNWLPCVGTTNVISSEQKLHLTFAQGPEPRVFFRVKTLNASPASFPLPQQRIENFQVSNDIQFDVVGGDIGNKFVIEKSTNFLNWTSYPTTNSVSGISTHVSLPKGIEDAVFFRTRMF